jgi:hypothetical protein
MEVVLSLGSSGGLVIVRSRALRRSRQAPASFDRSLASSGEAAFLLQLTALVEDDSHPGMGELTLMRSEVVGAQEQFAVTALRDEHAEQHISLGAAPIAAISRS